jgi:hypothetical protein
MYTMVCIHEFSSSTKCPRPPFGCHPTIEEYQYGLLMNSVGHTKSKGIVYLGMQKYIDSYITIRICIYDGIPKIKKII